MNNVDTCIMCGAIIPEGRQVCPICENKILQKPIKQDFSKQCNMNELLELYLLLISIECMFRKK